VYLVFGTLTPLGELADFFEGAEAALAKLLQLRRHRLHQHTHTLRHLDEEREATSRLGGS
tara:strand:- start:379 stop:558 length:180 start_codon:yes stop_codon:yes gene_type:complete